MSILVNSLYTCCVSTSPLLPVTVLSSAFLHSHFPRHRSRRFALTINGGPHGSFTAELECSISSSQSVDVCLGLDWKASVREWLIGLGLPPTNDFGPLQAVDPSTEGCPVTSAQVVIPSRVYPVPHTSSAPSEVAVPPMHPTLDRLKALANSLSSYPPSSLSPIPIRCCRARHSVSVLVCIRHLSMHKVEFSSSDPEAEGRVDARPFPACSTSRNLQRRVNIEIVENNVMTHPVRVLEEVVENPVTMHLLPGAEWVLLGNNTAKIERYITLDNRAEIQFARRQRAEHFDDNTLGTTYIQAQTMCRREKGEADANFLFGNRTKKKLAHGQIRRERECVSNTSARVSAQMTET
ncbi:hypothetical protein B0H13DRAFT_1894294 [Mycena leptocephala]|nr:hypothetical protein B0H13DRAFT_1894294 [Mycena leptocephala]